MPGFGVYVRSVCKKLEVRSLLRDLESHRFRVWNVGFEVLIKVSWLQTGWGCPLAATLRRGCTFMTLFLDTFTSLSLLGFSE